MQALLHNRSEQGGREGPVLHAAGHHIWPHEVERLLDIGVNRNEWSGLSPLHSFVDEPLQDAQNVLTLEAALKAKQEGCMPSDPEDLMGPSPRNLHGSAHTHLREDAEKATSPILRPFLRYGLLRQQHGLDPAPVRRRELLGEVEPAQGLVHPSGRLKGQRLRDLGRYRAVTGAPAKSEGGAGG